MHACHCSHPLKERSQNTGASGIVGVLPATEVSAAVPLQLAVMRSGSALRECCPAGVAEAPVHQEVKRGPRVMYCCCHLYSPPLGLGWGTELYHLMLSAHLQQQHRSRSSRVLLQACCLCLPVMAWSLCVAHAPLKTYSPLVGANMVPQ
jgi:hypothetical protein